jgi:multidrug resistance efflux pump
MSRAPSEIKKETSPETVEGNPSSQKSAQHEKSPIRRMTMIVFLGCFLLLVWYLLSNRYTPYSDNSRMNALIVPIVPKVSGYLKEIKVRLHSEVKANDTLFQIDQKMYALAVKSAEANMEKATQQMGIEGADIKSAAGRLGVAKAQLDRAQRNYDRVNAVLIDNPDALSQYDRDAAETALSTAIELVLSAEADLEKAKQQLGNVGAENVNLKMALTSYELARLNLYYSTLKAPSDGIIESFNLGKGHYCVPGQALTTLISTNDVWIQAAFSENSIENIKINDKVDFILDAAPGRIFKGKVRSMGTGVSSDQALIRGQLPNIKTKSGWLRPPQKFPVIISFSDKDKEVMKHFKLGGQVDVVVYTGNYFILNSIAKFRIWINSKLSYVR